MYRLDTSVTQIVPGQPSMHIDDQSFSDEPPKMEYLFQKIRPNGTAYMNAEGAAAN